MRITGIVPIFVLVKFNEFIFSECRDWHTKRPTKSQDTVQVCIVNTSKIQSRCLHINIASSNPAIDRLRLKQADKIFKIAHRASLECPTEIVGEVFRLLFASIWLPRTIIDIRRTRWVES